MGGFVSDPKVLSQIKKESPNEGTETFPQE